ncbi:serine hydrolase domain-containing protein [Gaoshiqia sediminis]|uniref:Beta-lactamase family protein n=1 Tax=Gaoshiqia sediminis TaxID=2986998 RepID=A0AA41Y3X0_9BACT|nr:serine hydrolase domain-containing protein [Gaoshiqia sediminis]MCW0482991.1 beta-lactamase family protein [Gaoshiqia sediminis]
MKNVKFKLFVLAHLIFLMSNINAQSKAAYPELIKESEALIIKKMESDQIIGVNAVILVDDSVIWKRSFGYADKENNVPMAEHTVVNIASATKTFTVLAIMQLQEKGLLDINQPINKYLPQFDPLTRGENLDDVTVKSVITHSSGIQTDVLKNGDLGSGKYTDVLGFINESYLLYPPGLVESYSNSGYNILGHLIKQVSGQDYPEYIHENIFAPLGMSSSGFFMDSLQGRTRVYSGGKSMHDYGFRDIASGGIYTNINDFIKYARELMHAYHGMNSPLIRTSTIREMFTLQTGSAVLESNKKGLGWFMFKNDSVFAVTHAGDAITGHAEICLIPDKNAAAIILINSAEGESLKRDFTFKFIHKFGLSVPDIIPPPVIKEVHHEINPIDLPLVVKEKHTGDYSQGFSYLTVSLDDDNLVIYRDGKQYILKALSEDEFVPYEVGQDSLSVKDKERYCFMDYGNFHILIHKKGEQESRLGYKLNSFNTSKFAKKLGSYEHYGYQLLMGDTKFKGAALSIADDRILMLKLIAYDGEYPFPLNVISDGYAITSGLGVGFGFTVKFTEDEKYDLIDFGGITFRKLK